MVAWYKHDIPAWTDGTASLSDGAYRAYHVICQQIYLNEGPIAFNERFLAGNCNQSVKAFRNSLKELIDTGKLTEVQGRLTNSRAVLELESVANNRKNAGEGGRNSGKVRKADKISNNINGDIEATLPEDRSLKTREEKKREEKTRTDSHPTGDDDHQGGIIEDQAFGTSPNEPASPPAGTLPFDDLGQNQTVLPRARGTALAPVAKQSRAVSGHVVDGFEVWWSAFPKKVARGGAQAKYAAILKAGKATESELLQGALRYAAEQAGKDPQFTKHATTWLNQGCWSDEPSKPSDSNGFGSLSPMTQRFLQNTSYLKDQQ